jgi:hypothetical protein
MSPRENQDHVPNRINWSAILASASVSFALVVSVLAWIATHPRNAALPLPGRSVAAVEPAAEPPPTPVFSATPAFYRSHPREGIAKNIPLIEEEPPPLPPPSTPQPPSFRPDFRGEAPWQAPRDALAKSAGETYGTQVLFHNNQEVAAALARHEHKLLFVMHISGNFEDSCFT